MLLTTYYILLTTYSREKYAAADIGFGNSEVSTQKEPQKYYYYLLPTTHYPLPTTHYSLLTTYYHLPPTYYDAKEPQKYGKGER